MTHLRLDVDALHVETFAPVEGGPAPSPHLPGGPLMDMNNPPSNGCTVICTLYLLPC